MKPINFLLICFVLAIASCQFNKKVLITGELKGYKPSTPIIYSISHPNGYMDMPDTVYADSAGFFSIRTSLDKPQMFSMYCKQDSGKFIRPMILIKPGEKHSITCKLVKDYNDKKASSVIGPNSEGQTLFASIDDGVRYSFGYMPQNDKWDLSKPKTLIDSFNIKIERSILPFEKLLKTKKIDKTFLDYSKNYISFYFAYQFAKVVEEAIANEKSLYEKEQLEKISDYIFKNYPGSDNEILNSSVLIDFMYVYNVYLKRVNKKEFDEYAAKGLTQTFELNKAKKILSNEAYKFYAINYIWSRASRKDKETLDLFEQYKLEYPGYTKNRSYQRLEKESIPAIIEFYSQKNSQLPEGVVFLDEDKPFKSFSELTTYFAGKPFFIDCWATWCGPCIYQFKFINPLKKFLKANNVEIVYIAFEKNTVREKVDIYCKNYNLTGHHIISNETFTNDFKNKIGIDSVFRIPRYILIDKTGHIAISDALFPDKKEKLYEQIQSKLNK